MHSINELNDLLRDAYQKLDAKKSSIISADILAEQVCAKLDPSGRAPALMRLAAKEGLKALARPICRDRETTRERESENGSLFDFKLQDRYSVLRGEDHIYIVREDLTLSDRRAIESRLRSESQAKAAHANALKAETDELLKSGALEEDTAAA